MQCQNEGGAIFDYWDKRRETPTRRRAQFYCVPSHRGGSVGTNRVIAALRIALDDLAGADLSAIADTDDDRAGELRAQIEAREAAIRRHRDALRRADTAYVSGAMDDERYQEQVRRLRGAITAEEDAIAERGAMLANEEGRGSRRDRLREIVNSGYAMLETEDTPAANAWFRRYVQVWVEANSIVEVRWL